MTDERAVRYRRLAMKESNPDTANLLRLLADQAEQGILHSPATKAAAAVKPASAAVGKPASVTSE